MLYNLTLCIMYLGVLFAKAMIVLLPVFIALYICHAIYTKKPLKQIIKEIIP